MRINKSLITYLPSSGAGSGTVTSVALTAPTGFSVSGSPITTSGTLALAFATGYGIPPLMTGNSGKFLTTNGTTMSWVNIAGTDVTGAALTEVDDTNVTMTLGGTPSTALLRSVSMTLGWAGQLAVSRGGTGAATLTGVLIGNGTSAVTAVVGGPNQILRRNSAGTAYEFFTASFLTNPMTLNFDMIYQASGVPARLAGPTSTTKQFLTAVGNGSATTSLAWGTIDVADITAAALTKLDDTNVTLTLGGNPNTSLLRAVSLTLGWTGTLAVSRGGTGASTLTGVLVGNGTSAVTAVVGTAGQFLRRNIANTAYEFRTLQGGDIAGSELTFTNDSNVTMSLSGTPASALLQPVGITLGWTGQLSVSRGGTGASTLTGVLIGNGTSAVSAITGTASQILRRNAANTAYEFFTASLISGNGVADSLAKWTSATNLIDSQIYDNGTNVLVGSSSDVGGGYKLQVHGIQKLIGTYTHLNFGELDANNVFFQAFNNAATVAKGFVWYGLDEYMRITSSGNVGVGTATPSAKFVVSNGGAQGIEMGWSSVLSSNYFESYNRSTSQPEDLSLYIGGNKSLRFYTNATERVTINGSGNVGIGTPTPSAKLEISGGSLRLPNLQQIEWGGSRNSIDGSDSTNTVRIWTNNINRINIIDNGSVGIGVNSPASLLDVYGSINIRDSYYLTFGGAYGTDIPAISGTSGSGTNGFLQFYPAGSTSGVKMALRRTGQLALPSYTSSSAFTGTAVATLAVTSAGDVITIASSQTTASGTYTPTWSGLANVDSVTAFSCQYMRVGDTVTVSGWVTINATADNTPTSLSFSLPINSNTSTVNYLNGTGVAQGGGSAACLSGYGSNFGEFEVLPAVDTAVNYSFHYTYRIV